MKNDHQVLLTSKTKQMNKNPKYITTPLHAGFMAAGIFTAAFAAGAEKLESPYFIDGLHCEGMEFTEEQVGSYVNSEKYREIGKKFLNQKRCEMIFEYFGVKKLSWMTQDEIELLSLKMEKADFLKSAELSMKKSELKNHVHLFANLKLKSGSKHFIELKGESHAGKDNMPDRSTGIFNYTYQNNDWLSLRRIGLETVSSTADESYDYSDLKNQDDEKIVLSTEDDTALSRSKEIQYQHLFTDFEYFHLGGIGNLRISLTNRGYGDDVDERVSSSQLSYSLLWNVTYPWSIEDQAFLGLEILNSNVNYLNDDEVKSDNISYIGYKSKFFAGNNIGVKARGHFDYYFSIGDKKSSFMDLDLVLQFGSLLGTGYHGLGFTGEVVNNAYLTKHSFYFNDYSKTDLFYRLNIGDFGGKHINELDIGSRSLSNGDKDSSTEEYNVAAPYISYSYTYRGESLEMKLSLTAQDGRIN